jgi:phosphatidate cytidylyltransferase
MLKQRLLTAAVLIPFVVCSILFLPSSIFQYLLAGIVILAGIEWFSIIGFVKPNKQLFASVYLLFIAVLLAFLPASLLLSLAIVVWTVIVSFVIIFAHKTLPKCIGAVFTNSNIALTMAVLVLALFWHGGTYLHASSIIGPQQLLYVMVLVWLADTGGYFAGKRWGKTPLAKAISPNKTWQGVAGAFFLGTIWSVLGFYLDFSGPLSLMSWLLLSVLALSTSIIGDLFESLFKRCYQVKDSGNLLPGHGGMLDRIDSLIAAVPVFTAGLYLLGAW